jgi:hypothetical protein
MTLEELGNSLPNGFHDCGLKRITVDYERRAIELDVSLWVADPGGPREQRDDYREATVNISGLVFCVMPQPDSRYDFTLAEELWIGDGYDTRSTPDVLREIDTELVKEIPSDAFLYSFFVHDWNAFIHIGAHGADLAWKNPALVKHRGRRRHFFLGDTINSD